MGATDGRKGASSMLTGRNIAGGIIVLVLLLFVLQNRNETKLSLLFWDITSGLWILVTITAVLAFASGFLFGRSAGRSSSKTK